MYSESLGRWRTADLLIGLAYLARREGQEHPVADIAAKAKPVRLADVKPAHQTDVLEEMRHIQRFMGYCLALRERRPAGQQAVFSSLGIEPQDVLMQEPRAGVLRPSFCLVKDNQLHSIVLAIRGTHSLKDMFTSLTGTSKPHHMIDPESGVVLGYSHFGMLAAARWLLQQLSGTMKQALHDHPGYKLKVIGHSLGGGTAAMLTMMMREWPEFADVTCLAIACPSCMTLDLARSCASYVTTIINGADLIPTVSAGSADALREEVMQSSWYEAFRSDMRSNVVVRAVESSVGRIGWATHAATSWTSSQLAFTGQGLRSCYAQRPRMLRKRSHQAFTDMEAEQPLSPVLRPPHQEMDSGDSSSDGDEVMGTGLPSPRGSAGKDWTVLEAAPNSLGPSSESVPTWGKVLGSLKSWGIAPATQSAATSRIFTGPGSPQDVTSNPQGQGVSASQPHSDDESRLLEGGARAVSDSEGLKAPLARRGSLRRGRSRGEAGSSSSQQQDRLRNSLDGSQVSTSGAGSAWGLGRVTGWGQRTGQTTKAVGEKVGTSGKTAYRSFVSRWWLQECRSDPYQAMEMHSAAQHANRQQEQETGEGMGDGDEGPLAALAAEGLPLPAPGQFDAEVQAAQAAAAEMEEEARAHAGDGGWSEHPLPDQDPGHLPGLEESLQRRTMYPAGRILHLVPARLVFDADELAKLVAPEQEGSEMEVDPQATAALLASTPLASGPVIWPKPPTWAPPMSPQSNQEVRTSAAALQAATAAPQTPLELAASVAIAVPGPHHRPSTAQDQASAGDSGTQMKGRTEAKQWIKYDSNVAEVDGTLHVFSDAAVSDDEAPGPPREREKYVLLDSVPQEAYGRIKLCSTMIQDHFIPCYSANMQTAMELYIRYSKQDA
ncbi:MAG: lipase class 3 family [Trebouxia sp. A1-2]|nr:MAG: lipase class 3 family [Trebouxia sp. A1-2]